MSQSRDVLELWRRLRQESLFVTNEREGLNRLHQELKGEHQNLLEQLYLTRRLHGIEMAAESGADLTACSIEHHRMDQTQFSEMAHQEQEQVAKFMQLVKENPTLIAACLVYGEKMQLESSGGFAQLLETVVLSIFGQSCATQNQTTLLEFIQCLMLHQIGSTDKPRQALKRGAFISTYRLLVEALPESRLFLTAALYGPITAVLLDEGPPLEADPAKVIGTFEPRELHVRFGQKGTPQFEAKLGDYCRQTSKRLEEHVKRFSAAIEASLACFPSSIGYIISRAHNIVSDGGMCPPAEARTLACDLLLQDFICLAIVSPERYGVTGDLPIPDKARINLMQIAQQLQRKVMSPGLKRGDFLTRMVEEVLTLDTGDSPQLLKMGFEDRTVICERKELKRIVTFLIKVLESGVHGVDAEGLQRVLQPVSSLVQKWIGQNELKNREKSPQSKFFDKIQNSVDKIDKKMKQIQVDGIQAVKNNDADAVVVPPPEPVYVIPLPGRETEFRIMSENEVVSPPAEIDEAGSIDDDGQSRGSKSNYSEVDDQERPGSSSSSVSDHLSSFQGSAGTHVDLDRAQDETDSIAESNPHTNRDEALKLLDQNIPSSRESIDDKMRKFELGVRFDIQERDARSDCWSIENAVSEPSEPLTEAEYRSRLEEIAEEMVPGVSNGEQQELALRVQPEDSRSDICENEDDDRNNPNDENRSRASTPGLSGVSASSSAFSEPANRAGAATVGNNGDNDQQQQQQQQEGTLIDLEPRNGNRSPRPSVLLPTKAWQQQQEKLGGSQKRISPVESVDNEPKSTSRKKGIFKLGGDKSASKSRGAIPSKYLPSALRKKRNDSASKVETDSPLIQDNQIDDVMAKYQTLTKKEPEVGQLINLESASPPVEQTSEKSEKTSESTKKDNDSASSRVEDVRRKLRYVLSASDPVDSSPMMQPSTRSTPTSQKDKLLELMRAQSYEALAIQDRTTAAQLQETVRSILPLTEHQTNRVIDSMWKEYQQRSTYTKYLIRARQKLLASLAHIKHMAKADSRVRETSRRQFYCVAAQAFLKKKHESIRSFINVYKSPQMQTMDDKAALVEKLLNWLNGELQQEKEWQSTSNEALVRAQTAVHRNLMSRKDIYHCVLYPNNEIDIERDRVFSDHISRISAKLTPHHSSLKIPSKYCRECPWPTAQEEAQLISIYRTPKEKMEQASRLCKAILNLLKLSNPFNVPGADDLVPVLVFVIVKANPPSLLSTIQFVDTFEKQASGEDAFYWMQFTAACKFIQTIEI